MGNCISAAARVKAESPSHTGVHLGNVSPDESSSINASVPPTPRSEGDILQSPNLKRFSFSNLKLATKNFRSNNVVGEGGFGMVFKGWLDENTYAASKSETGMLVAVKRLNQESAQGHREWLAEVNYLGQFSHPHLVKLIGFCLEDAHRLLVYEFVPRGSLEYHLFRRGSYHQPLSWELRLKVAIGAAKGLAFLHSAETKVIYRDFKTANVLLDSDYNAKLSDFGLARDAPTDGKSHVSTRIMGTQGYAAPEYLATGHLTAKSDVYSFGVVLLEMLSGRKAVDYNRPSGEHNLVEWARPFLTNKRKIFKFLDTRIEGQCKLDAAHRVATLACRCISVEARLRPSMAEVLTELERIQDYKDSENSENGTRDETRFRGKGVVNAASIRSPSTVSYPRPSDSPLYA